MILIKDAYIIFGLLGDREAIFKETVFTKEEAEKQIIEAQKINDSFKIIELSDYFSDLVSSWY